MSDKARPIIYPEPDYPPLHNKAERKASIPWLALSIVIAWSVAAIVFAGCVVVSAVAGTVWLFRQAFGV